MTQIALWSAISSFLIDILIGTIQNEEHLRINQEVSIVEASILPSLEKDWIGVCVYVLQACLSPHMETQLCRCVFDR